MIHINNLFRLLCLSLSMIVVSATAAASYAPVVESILHNGFPTQPDVLAKQPNLYPMSSKRQGTLLRWFLRLRDVETSKLFCGY